jgi:hypothetical protein
VVELEWLKWMEQGWKRRQLNVRRIALQANRQEPNTINFVSLEKNSIIVIS